MGEKVAVSPTGSATFTVPLPISPSRAPAGTPQLSLTYDSGSGNGPFGLGWTLSLPAIARRTEKSLPRYQDGDDSDVFQLAGYEDLVPALVEQNGAWVRDSAPRDGFRVDRYRPRVEAAFARIERWTDQQSGDAYWQVVDKDNVTSVFGRSSGARIADPTDPRRVYKWLLEETRDDKGNVVSYVYKTEDATAVDVSRPEERNRLGIAGANRYLKYVYYGNQTPFVADRWSFELVFDYGEHDDAIPTPEPVRTWTRRTDPFSTYRAGFEIRTWRLCRRVLLFHLFDALTPSTQLVRSLELRHAESPVATTVTALVASGHAWNGAGYRSKSLPAVELGYTTAAAAPQLTVLARSSADNLPVGIASSYQWVDLDSEGLSGVLTEQAQGWYYKRNLGGGELGALEQIATRPRSGLRAGAQLLDLAADGRKYLVELGGPLSGYYRRDDDPDTWSPFVPFASMPALDWKSPFQRMLDLDGDGRADVLVTEDEVWSWYPSLGADGFGDRQTVAVGRDEEDGPVLVFSDPTQSIYLADLSGDGLVDLVRVRNGEVCYWPNLGFGRFGAKVTMSDAPVFDRPDQFDPRRVRFADIDGAGALDLLYVGRGDVTYWCNQAGNGWSEARVFDHLPIVDDLASVAALDFLGNGTSCIVWSSTLPRDAGRPLAYLDLMGGQKPYLLASVRNNLGAETAIRYAPSTRTYVDDRTAGQPWVTRVPYPVQVVERIETRDAVTGNRFVSTYTYHHGYYDGPEQEFRGFARVDQLDTEEYAAFAGAGLLPPGTNVEEELHVPPVLTRTWYHTGAFLDGERIAAQLATEYWQGDPDPQAALLADTELPTGLSTAEQVQAVRALKGQVLRQEVYALDGTGAAARPYVVSERSYAIVPVQPLGDNPYAVFFSHARESIELHYERGAAPRVTHAITLDVDPYGNVTRSVAIAYPLRGGSPYPEQTALAMTIAENDVINVDSANGHRIGVPVEQRSYEVVPAGPLPARYQPGDFTTLLPGLTDVAYELAATPGTRRLLARSQTLYYLDDLSGPAPLRTIGARALTYETYRMTLTPGLVAALWGGRVTDAMLTDEARYVARDGAWWTPSGRAVRDPARFYLAVAFVDPFGNTSSAEFDSYALLVTATHSSDDPVLDNVVRAEHDYRTLGAIVVTDANGNRAKARTDELGLVIATAAMGKADGPPEGDTLDDPTNRFEYDLTAVPAWSHASMREQHGAANTRWLEMYEYSDGFGRLVQQKARAAPDPTTQAARWVGTGRTVFDNKGQPIKQYEPFYSATSAYEDEAALVTAGVTSVIHYDAVGRVVRTDFPDGSLSRVEVAAWQTARWDQNDTVLDSRWYQEATAATASDEQRRAAQLTAAHASTPTIACLDPLGRTFLTIADNGADGTIPTRTVLDIQDRIVAIRDHADQVVASYGYDMLGQRVYQRTLDGGERWSLADVSKKAVRAWDSRGHARQLVYDRVGRPTHAYLATDGGAPIVVERTVYGEAVPGARDANLIGRTFRHYDGAGLVTTASFDFKGNQLTGERRLARDYQDTVDWSVLATLTDPDAIAAAAEPQLELGGFPLTMDYDAVNRITRLVTPDLSEASPGYDERGQLDRMTVAVRGGAPVDFVKGIDYDAKGQRQRIEYDAGARTDYDYDRYTFRLVGVTTTRIADGALLQALSYTYDPIGNVVAIADAAQSTIYFKNSVVSPGARYEFDAIYRLRHAEGREQATSQPPDWNDGARTQRPSPDDGAALQRYAEDYTYDPVGNLLSIVHAANQGSWTRTYDYLSDSNRLIGTDGATGQYSHDAHGNMTAMPHLASIEWNDRDQMAHVDLGGGGAAYYTYGSSGLRVRKVIVRPGGAIVERIYVGAYEVYRERDARGVTLERQSLHVMDNRRRVAIVDTLTIDGGLAIAAPEPVVRYQLANLLESAVLEVDASCAVISYEEYYPYGSTSYQAGRSIAETSLKRYRYTGKERDDETGFYYHGARYYAPWLARWTAVDPVARGSESAYCYTKDNPIVLVDPDGANPVILLDVNGNEIAEMAEADPVDALLDMVDLSPETAATYQAEQQTLNNLLSYADDSAAADSAALDTAVDTAAADSTVAGDVASNVALTADADAAAAGNAALGDAALGDAALGDAALGDAALGDAALADSAAGAGSVAGPLALVTMAFTLEGDSPRPRPNPNAGAGGAPPAPKPKPNPNAGAGGAPNSDTSGQEGDGPAGKKTGKPLTATPATPPKPTVPMTLDASPDAACWSTSAHGNSYKSCDTQWLYVIEDANGEVLKYGTTRTPTGRYTADDMKNFGEGSRMVLLSEGNVRTIRDMEKKLIQRYGIMRGDEDLRPPMNKCYH